MQTARIWWSALAIAAFAALAATAVRAEAPPAQRFEIPAGDLVRALEALSRQIPVSLIYQPDQIRGMKTEGVSGVLTPRDAVLKLLRGSALQLSTDASTGALLVTSLNVRSQRTREGPPVRNLAGVDEPMSATDVSDVRRIEELVVTGSMLNSSVIAEEGAAPVRVLSLDTIRRGGATTVYEALRGMPELAGYADNDSRSGARDTREVNLRGLGAQYTLVLINGRRLGQNNLNLVPFAAVERIEILKDGASAVYGSDALAGVVNVILRRDYDGVEVTADYGNSTHFADAGKANFSTLLGTRGERVSVLVSGQFEKQTPARSTEHPLGRSDDLRSWGSRDLRFQRLNPGRIRLGNGSEVMLDPSFGDGTTGASPLDYVPAYDNKIDKLRVNNLQNRREVGTFFGGGTYRLGEHVELFADFLYKSSNIDYVDHRGVLLDFDVPASNYWNPFGEDVHVSYLLDATAPGRRERDVETLNSDMRTSMSTIGFKGTIGPLTYNLAHTDWRSSDMQSHAGLSRNGIIAQLARSDPGALNVFGNAAVTAEQLAPARAKFRRELTEFVRSTTGIVTFEPFALPAGRAAAAVGFEVRNQGFDSQLDEALSRYRDSISLVFLNDISIQSDRDVDAAFTELKLPLSADEASLGALELTLAARHERFSDFGNATVKRGTLRWQPRQSDSLTLRASYSESFYAPELRDIQPFGDVNFGVQSDPAILGADGQPVRYSMTNIAGGNPDLDPTVGEYLNLGVIFKPAFAPGLGLTLDAWRLDQNDAFVYPTVQAVIDGTGPGVVTRNPVALPGEPIGRIVTVVNRVANAAQRTVAGIDLNVSYERATQGWGRWSVASYNTFITRFDFNQKDGRGTQNALGLVGPVFDMVPRFRSNLVVGNRLGPLSIALATSYVASISNSYDNYRRVEPYVRSDLTLRYEFSASPTSGGVLADAELWFGVQDVFDEGAPFVAVRTQGVASDYTYVDYIGQFWTVGFRSRF